MDKKTFVGFGFGPIQGGLFVSEAFESGNFSRLVVAEIDNNLVDALRNNCGCYNVNIARSDCIDVQRIEGVEIYNPNVDQDRAALLEALYEASEIATSLPAVKFYDMGDHSVASLIAQAITNSKADSRIIYAAENNNRAAEILQKQVESKLSCPLPTNVQFLNTVIGKMSQVATDIGQITDLALERITPDIDRAFLVEEFNRILITRIQLEEFQHGIDVFIEKDNLLPFEEAKLYGHNAIHALLAYLGAAKGYTNMTELKNDPAVMKIAKDAFLNESGAALISKYSHLNDELFTQAGYQAYAEDLLQRMTNPYLSDTIARAARDPKRKLAYNDRIFGTMDLALMHGIEPINMAKGALAGIEALLKEQHAPQPADITEYPDDQIDKILRSTWGQETGDNADKIIALVQTAKSTIW